ncbi:MAG: fructokinase [Chthoniobacter sp.]|nr:fructokinase [Chthoniobacter sp.]
MSLTQAECGNSIDGNSEFYAFGEILWDCLPSGRHAGGAPFNVAAHLAQLGVTAALISSIGQDSLGDEILKVAEDKGVDTEFVTRARSGLPTGTVLVTLDANSNATYELVQPAAWDEVKVSAKALEAVTKARAFIFGSLASRSSYNLDQLDHLLALKGPMKFFDVNLRPPFADPTFVLDLAKRADVIKLND